jgi:ribosomal protein S18 acetylase RimI-like enzyme
MPGNGKPRNRFRHKRWIFQPFNREPGSYKFDCDNPKVNEFFLGEFLAYERLLLCKTYELTTEEVIAENLDPIAFISYSNHAIKLSGTVRERVKLPEAKPLKQCPATKIVWLGVSKDSQQLGVGTDLLNITKLLFISNDNRAGCLLITVDAMNDPDNDQRPIRLYKKAGFEFENPRNNPDDNPRQRIYPMLFNLGAPWDYDPDALEPIYSREIFY